LLHGPQTLQVSRLVRKSESRARRLAQLQIVTRPGCTPARRDLDFTERRLHGARLRRGEVRAFFAPALYRHGDSEFDGSVGRAAGQTRDVVLRAIRALQPEGRKLGREA